MFADPLPLLRRVTSFWSGLLPSLTPAVLCAACPETPAPTCQDQVCTPQETVCVGNAFAVCGADGKAWTVSGCGAAKQCQAGICANRVCTDLGLGTCSDEVTLKVCTATGLAQSTEKCASGEICKDVACVPATCKDGDLRCGDHKHLFTCSAGAWTYETCAEACGDADSKPACVSYTCTPESATCDGDAAARCDHTGLKKTAKACGAGQVCRDGFCQTKLCGAEDPADGSTADGGADTTPDAEVTPPPVCGDKVCDPDEACHTCAFDCGPCPTAASKIEFTVGQTKESMTIDAKAEWNSTDKTIFMKAASGIRKIEIHVQKVDPLAVGTWDDTDATSVVVKICYVDGSSNPSLACAGSTPGFTHNAVLYKLTIAENNGVGSRIKGTFEATLQNDKQEKVPLTGGTFDLSYFN